MNKKLFLGFTISVILFTLSFYANNTNNNIGNVPDNLLFGTSSVMAQSNAIVIEGADSIWETSTQYSGELTGVSNEVTPKILAEYTDSIYSQDLVEPDQLNQQAYDVSPRILVEYADSILNLNLEPPVFISNSPPAANAGSDQTVTVGMSVVFDGSSSTDTDGSIVSYEWDFGDGSKGTGKTVSHIYSNIGTYTVTLTVTDDRGTKSSDSLVVQIVRDNKTPIINSLSAQQSKVLPGATTTISVLASDPDNDNLTYKWSAGGGSISGNGATVVWTAPNNQGDYTINLEIDDGHGGIIGRSIVITVSTETEVSAQNPQMPYVNLYGHLTNVNVGEEIILYLSVINPITSPGKLSVQVTLSVPSGWSITSSGFGNVVGGMSTNTYEIEQGPNNQAIDVHILANEPFQGDVKGYMDYYFQGDETKYHRDVVLPVTASLKTVTPDSTNQSSPPPEETDLSRILIPVIIGVCTATIGGVLARVIWKRMHSPGYITVPAGNVNESRKSPSVERQEPKEQAKKPDKLAPDLVPEEKILDIQEGQKGISYRKLFTPYIKDSKIITIYDPYIQAPYQIANLREFCEIIDTHRGKVKVKLVTSRDEFQDSKQESKLNEFKKELSQYNIDFDFDFDDKLHDRWIETDTGWRIMLGRGLDIFQPGIGFSDQTKRQCRKTTITYKRINSAS